MEQHCWLPKTLRTPLRRQAGESAPSPQTPLSQLHSCQLSADQKQTNPLGPMHPPSPPRWRMDVHRMENRVTDPRNRAGEGHCWMLLLWQSTLTLGMKLIPPSLVLPQDQQSLKSFPKAAEKALTRKDGVETPNALLHQPLWPTGTCGFPTFFTPLFLLIRAHLPPERISQHTGTKISALPYLRLKTVLKTQKMWIKGN